MSSYLKLKPIKPHYAEGLAYQRKLEKLILKMHNDIYGAIKKNYTYHEKRITNMAQDARPGADLKSIINKNMREWRSIWSKLASKLSIKFLDHVDQSVQRDLLGGIIEADKKLNLKNFRKSFSVKVQADTQSLLDKKQAAIQANIDLIKSIPQKYHEQINWHVNEAVTRGRDWGYLSKKIEEIGHSTTRRARYIAKDQLVKATNVISNQRQQDLGIEENEWGHSGGDKVPRPSHLAAEGKIYKIKEGCKIDGEYIQPGEKPGCTCYSTPVIKI